MFYLRFINLIVLMLLIAAIIYAVYWVIDRRQAAEQAKHKKKVSERDRDDSPMGHSAPQATDAGVRQLILEGRIDEATDLYQRFTGVDVFTAKDAIADIQRELKLSDVEGGIRDYLEAGDKAAAIEYYQDQTGAELAEALEVVEILQEKQR
jgi:hypothetical protein